MVFAAFAVWVLLILLMGMAVYRLWGNLLGPRRADWVLLPGSVVSELAYSIGLLLTGRPAAGGLIRRSSNTAAPGQRPTGKYRFAISMLAGLTSLAGGFAVLAATTNWIGTPLVRSLVLSDLWRFGLPKELPGSGADLKELICFQWDLLRRLGEAVTNQDWLTWQTPLFVYLSICFAIRLGAVRHDWRASLATAGALLVGVALVGSVWDGMEEAITQYEFWSLLTYTWVVLLAILAGTVLAAGMVAIVRAFRGKNQSKTN